MLIEIEKVKSTRDAGRTLPLTRFTCPDIFQKKIGTLSISPLQPMQMKSILNMDRETCYYAKSINRFPGAD
ncbi:hypothetical protein CEXT_341791 [Caerostris extrusa]|uniref:Uncharacterized protein n=1 Tax=Caerostris extrusa TaxID=172846 RepID=A0AAV4QPE1_CAEEX|nr:hypothetical protein CEXT_341791 [Caerostris extrusa]